MTAENVGIAIAPTVFPIEPLEAGKGGEAGAFQIGNAEFIDKVFPLLPEGAFAAVSSKSGDPGLGGWPACRADVSAMTLSTETNNFIGCSSFYPGDDGLFRAGRGSGRRIPRGASGDDICPPGGQRGRGRGYPGDCRQLRLCRAEYRSVRIRDHQDCESLDDVCGAGYQRPVRWRDPARRDKDLAALLLTSEGNANG